MTITNAAELKNAIEELEQQRINQEMEILYNLNTYAQGVKDTLVNISMGVGTGMVAKKIFTNKESFLGRLAGDVVQGIVTTGVVGNAAKIKAVGQAVWKNVFKK